jgi:hypothetical protein
MKVCINISQPRGVKLAENFDNFLLRWLAQTAERARTDIVGCFELLGFRLNRFPKMQKMQKMHGTCKR